MTTIRRSPREIIDDFKRQKQAKEAKEKEKRAAQRRERELAWQERYRRRQKMLKQAEVEAVKRGKVKVLPIDNTKKMVVDGEITLNLTKLPYGHKGYELFKDCYQTEKELMEAENSPLETGKINWEVFHKLVQEFKEDNGI